ncbi:hypothetical protein SAMN05216266_1377 [Amycolatopsis marina]|uniref:SpaA-like prealbumin fold domain-containing protein n=1 Tax=Amycolatopsis marina TaxID=490629 RepID=A0A1I1CT34_9PSEU|nr:hypothetical protein [Amycolatopsis marina]SFB63740.1 hypothetical protein SAMN05216266_1377 [Amycolatopsis marina]
MGCTTHPVAGVRAPRRLVGLLTVALLGALSLVALAQPASAAVDEGIGHEVSGQPYQGSGGGTDWLGSYIVGGKQVFCVQFQYKAPDTDEKYEPGDELLTKWGDKLSADVAANISYLLLRYGDTENADEAAALAHLLHSWTAAPRNAKDLDPKNTFKTIGYDVDLHFDGLPAKAKQAVEKLRSDAEANRGPWTAEITPPEDEQLIGSPAEWKVTVKNAKGAGVPDVPVTLTIADAMLEESGDAEAARTAKEGTEGTETAETANAETAETSATTVTTGEDGTATVTLVSTGENPKLTGALSAPADRPYVRFPVDGDTQRVVSTGGEQELTAEATTTARTQPGIVQITKKNSRTGDGIAGVSLRLTAKDKTTPAVGQDGTPLEGEDGKPVVLETDGNGIATVENLRTPQEVCIVEVSAPAGFDQGFDPDNPPSACGQLAPGETLALELANAPNEVPRTIPAGTQPTVIASTAGTSGPSTGALVGIGSLALLGTALVGWTARRRFVKQ